jgi:zinc and cadmium transporter
MPLIITTIVIILASLSGLIFLARNFSDWLHKNSKFIIAFSAGIFAVVTYDLFIEAFEFSSHWVWATLSIIVGFTIFHIAEKVFPELHHHDNDEVMADDSALNASVHQASAYDVHTDHTTHEASHQSPVCLHSRRNVIWGDLLHNIGDGALLAIAFTVDIRVGIIAGVGIFIHEFIQEITEFSILKLSGMSTKKALIINFLVSLSVIPGVFIGLYLAQIETMVAVLFGLAGGAFAHLIFTDLIPHSLTHSKREKRYFIYILLILAGIALILGLNELSGGHGHGGVEHTDDHDEYLEMHDEYDDAHDIHHDEHEEEHGQLHVEVVSETY